MARNLGVLALCIAVSCLLVQCVVVWSHEGGTVYHVGDDKGWDLNSQVKSWPNGKNFKAGDVLVFKYDTPFYRVAAVDETEFNQCKKKPETKVYESMNDRFVLHSGPNYFMAAIGDYCGYGMKIQVNAQ